MPTSRREANEEIKCGRYSFNLVKLSPDRQESLKSLYYQVKDTIDKFEENTEEKVESFYIGKTYADTLISRTFDKADPHTWKKKGISNRWKDHKKK